MQRTVVIDFLPESASRYGPDWAVVAIDVIRATTTAVTAAALGRRCCPVPSLEAAEAAAAVLERPVLCGELGGSTPFGFEITNSPVAVAGLGEPERPLVLLSSSGTQLIHLARGAGAVYLACLRNVQATALHLAAHHPRVAVIGAGTRGEFREEDQFCCARVAEALLRLGYCAGTDETLRVLARWVGEPEDAWRISRSVDYLRRSDQLHDLEFILAHRGDVPLAVAVEDGEAVARHPGTGARAFPVAVSPLQPEAA